MRAHAVRPITEAGFFSTHFCFSEGTMTKRTLLSIGAVALAAALAGCSGGGGGSASLLPGGGGGNAGGSGNATAQSETAIATTNALGSPLKSVADDNAAISPQSAGDRTESSGNGSCNNYSEFFAPDKNGDPNSTETILFYDSACTQPARDAVRIFSSTGATSETVNRTVKNYAQGNGTPIATRAEATTITNATFDANGFPKVATGFDRVVVSSLDLSGIKTIDEDHEQVMLPQSGSVNQYCGDTAGFNATGFAALNETFGWSGGTSGVGTRTVNGDGTITWSATHAGTNYKGTIGSLSIVTGSQNVVCPITAPMFTLAGGTSTGAYTIPMSATYQGSILTNLTISNAQLASGATLNVTTNAGVAPTASNFISGTIANGGTQIATFNVDTFGDGVLTVTATGVQYVINDWHVVKLRAHPSAQDRTGRRLKTGTWSPGRRSSVGRAPPL
jgi:hypothetical protein